MRIFTVIAGVLLSATGGFCFAFGEHSFMDLAFLVGIAMILSGICDLIAYIISGRGKDRLTETALVEGVVTALYGFAVLNDQVSDAMLTMFFGLWLVLCGATRFAQSLVVSRYEPRHWAKIVPLSAVALMLGFIMLMPQLLNAAEPLMLCGTSFIINGFSLIIFAMYMKGRKPEAQAALEAAERAENRKAAAEAKKEQREALRNMDKAARAEAMEEFRQEKKRREQAELEARLAEEAEEEEQSVTDSTISFTPEETAQIRAAAGEALTEEAEPSVSGPAGTETAAEDLAPETAAEDAAPETAAEALGEPEPAGENKSEDAPAEEARAAEDKTEDAPAEEAPAAEEKPEDAPSEGPASGIIANEALFLSGDKLRPVWKKPTDIPSLRKEAEVPEQPAETVPEAPRINAINIEELESAVPDVKFDEVELPSVEYEAKGGESESREDIIKDIEDLKAPGKAEASYVPLRLEDLIPEEDGKSLFSEADKTRFTQTFIFKWDDDK